jgi:hypothetical protein
LCDSSIKNSNHADFFVDMDNFKNQQQINRELLEHYIFLLYKVI